MLSAPPYRVPRDCKEGQQRREQNRVQISGIGREPEGREEPHENRREAAQGRHCGTGNTDPQELVPQEITHLTMLFTFLGSSSA